VVVWAAAGIPALAGAEEKPLALTGLNPVAHCLGRTEQGQER